ncbi:MAG: hypothetical protein ACSLFM_12230 [Tepidiformaceae bacterium]
MTTSPTCILAYTSEDDRYDYVLKSAVETALSSGAALILYDIDAAGAWGEEPLPTWVAADGETEQVPNRLEPADLERAGRIEVARKVNEARTAGVRAYGWLTGSKGAGRLAEYADEQNVDLIMLPEDLDDPSFIQSLRGQSVDAIKEETGRPVVVVRATAVPR